MQFVVDANILFAALIKDGLTAEILLDDFLLFYTPEFVFEEFGKHKKEILEKTKRTHEEYEFMYQTLRSHIKVVPKEEYEDMLEAAGVLFSKTALEQNRRWDVLRGLAEIGIYVDPDKANLITFDQSFSKDGIEGFIANEKGILDSMGIEGVSLDNELLVASPSALQHELQHIFDNISLLVLEKGEELDNEFRAYLGELAFARERRALCREWIKESREKKGREGLQIHEAARLMIGDRLSEGRPKSAKAIIGVAMGLLNEAYRKACGLSYDQILEPFSKIKG